MFTKKFLSVIVLSACLVNVSSSYTPHNDYAAATPVVAPAPLYEEASPIEEIPEEAPEAYLPKEETSEVTYSGLPEESPSAYLPKEETSEVTYSEIPEESPSAYLPKEETEVAPATTPCATPSEEQLYEQDHDYAPPAEEEETELSETGYEAPLPTPGPEPVPEEEELTSETATSGNEYVPKTIVHDNANDIEYNAEDVINEEEQLSEQDKAYQEEASPVVHDNVNDPEYNAEDVMTELECEEEEEAVEVPTPTPCTSTYEMAGEEEEEESSPAATNDGYDELIAETVGYDETPAAEAAATEFKVSPSTTSLSAANVAVIAVGSVAAVAVIGAIVWRYKNKKNPHNEMPITPFVESQI